MFKINRAVGSILLYSLVLFVSGCSTTSRITEITNVPNEKWRITSAVVHAYDNGWRVSGRLNSHNIFSLPAGYILISIMSEDGVLLDQKKTKYRRIKGNARQPRRHEFGVALFFVEFDSIPENAKVIAEHIINR